MSLFKERLKQVLKIIRASFTRFFIKEEDPFEKAIMPRTILMLGLGKTVRGNLQYLLNELNTDEAYSGFQVYVRTSRETDQPVLTLIGQNGWVRTKTVPDDNRYAYLLETVEFLLTETYFPDRWVKRPGQVCINIWHGTPLKKIGPAKNSRNCHRNGPSQRNFINADYLLYPNEYTKEKMLVSYRVEPLMRGKSLMMGYPRTGGMLSATEDEIRDIRIKLAVHGEKKIYAFMPTYRGILMTEEKEAEQISSFLDFMEMNLGKDQILYVNLHHKMELAVDYTLYEKILPFPSDMDSYLLLAASDALITDYSSVMFDYLALRRQIVLYIPDYDNYRKKRGLFMDITKLPFDQAYTPEEALKFLNSGKQYDDTAVNEEFCAYDSPENAKKLCRLFLKDETGLILEPPSKHETKKLLVHTEWAPAGSKTDLIAAFADSLESTTYEIYFSCNEKIQAKKSGAYPLFRKFPVIGSSDEPYLTEAGTETKKRYLDGKLSFEKAMEILAKEYSRMTKRMYGEARFQAILIYDCANPERMIGLSESGLPCILFLHEDIMNKIDGGDVFLQNAVCYAAGKSSFVLVENETELQRTKLLLDTFNLPEPVICPDKEHLGQVIKKTLGI